MNLTMTTTMMDSAAGRSMPVHERKLSMTKKIAGLAVMLVLCGCAATSSYQGSGERLAGRKTVTSEELGQDLTSGGRGDEDGVTGVESYPGSGVFINEEAARRRPSVVSDDGEIVLNFEGESVQSVVHTILGEVLQETFVIGPGVSGQVTFATAKPVSSGQLMPILELLLRWNGATMVYSEGRYHILPIADAIKGHLAPQIGDSGDVRGYEVRAVPLRYIGAEQMAKILEPYARDNAIVNVDNLRSMIFLAGTREELANYLQTIEIFDIDWLKGMSVGIYPLKTVDVQSISTELTEIFGNESESPLAGMFRFVPLERLGSLLVITPQPEYLDKSRDWIEMLDRGAAGAGTQLYVYRVQNLEATVLAGYLSQLFGGAAGPQRRTSRGTLAPGLEPVTTGTVSQFNENRRGAGNNQQGAGDGGGVINTEEGEIRITSVIETNSLLIQSTQSQYDGIRAAIERIDQEPLQVLIEAQVVDVALNDSLQFGVNWFLSNRSDLTGLPEGVPEVGPGDFGEVFGAAQLSGGSFFSTLNRFSGNGERFVQATISALDAVSDVRTLAAPSLLVRNNAQATITVGTQVPVQSSSISTGTNNVVSSAQYVSTGVTLTVTPRINPGGLVYLDIQQDVSFPGERDENVSTSGNPPINSKSVTSQVAVQSGQTVFLGGLIQESANVSQSGLPFLSRVPVIGRLFGSKLSANDRTETLVMITPTVIENSADLEAVSRDLEDEFKQVPPMRIHILQKQEQEANEAN
jgi:general secretion pathway protein D